MTRTFIQTEMFEKKWKELGLTDEDLCRLEYEIMKNPKAGSVIRGTGRLRKMRFSVDNKGKSGSVRVCYVDFVVLDMIYLFLVYPKNEKENLTKEECNNLKKMINLLEKSLMKEV